MTPTSSTGWTNPRWQTEPPEKGGWYVIRRSGSSPRLVMVRRLMPGEDTIFVQEWSAMTHEQWRRQQYTMGWSWLVPALDLPPLPEEEP